MGKGYLKRTIDGVTMELHRHIVTKREGRKLSRNEVVHHDDRNTYNNASSNLILMSRSDHARLHSIQNWSNAEYASKVSKSNAYRFANKSLTDVEIEIIKGLLVRGWKNSVLAKMYHVPTKIIKDIKIGKVLPHED